MTEWSAKKSVPPATDIEIRGKRIPRVIVQILQNRGYDTPQKIEEFFAPSLDTLYDPFLMRSMDKAVERIIQAIRNKEHVLIHGDYDTDGITGVALLMRHLEKLGTHVEYYIPQRLVEGYGLSMAGIQHALQQKCSLIVTVDCGITAVDEIAYANNHSVDVVVCDHHKPKESLPLASALIDPKLPGDAYPFKELAGVGVAFKVLQALYNNLKLPKEELYIDLDLVALGSVVDVVPLIDENRTLVKYGINKIVKSQKDGFRALLEETGLKRGLTAYHLGFIIGPRINACGRLRDAREALELFLTDDKAHAAKLARNLSQDNTKRQEVEDAIYNEARRLIEQAGRESDRVVLVGKEGWHEGVIGIVASRISEDYYRPAILFALKKDIAKGSARSIKDFDITEALHPCAHLLLKYGGHSQAAGIEMKRENVSELRTCINKYAEQFDVKVYKKRSYYDLKLDLDEITDEVVYFLKFFEPTGTANPQPVFYGENFEVVGVPRVIADKHLKFALRNKGKALSAIAYEQAEDILNIEVGKTRIDCLYSVAEDSFLGKKKVVLKVKEMRKSNIDK
ncbi:MAG: single-stranded-DNA-specific exonuclease RecJ [candidate division WOR-3 bacterium]|nr:MAG: single-stranded-DNA-specific exonuclease RecJ [candidate division WOR-3 bacterium]